MSSQTGAHDNSKVDSKQHSPQSTASEVVEREPDVSSQVVKQLVRRDPQFWAPTEILQLQRVIGNQVVTRLLTKIAGHRPSQVVVVPLEEADGKLGPYTAASLTNIDKPSRIIQRYCDPTRESCLPEDSPPLSYDPSLYDQPRSVETLAPPEEATGAMSPRSLAEIDVTEHNRRRVTFVNPELYAADPAQPTTTS